MKEERKEEMLLDLSAQAGLLKESIWHFLETNKIDAKELKHHMNCVLGYLEDLEISLYKVSV